MTEQVEKTGIKGQLDKNSNSGYNSIMCNLGCNLQHLSRSQYLSIRESVPDSCLEVQWKNLTTIGLMYAECWFWVRSFWAKIGGFIMSMSIWWVLHYHILLVASMVSTKDFFLHKRKTFWHIFDNDLFINFAAIIKNRHYIPILIKKPTGKIIF